MNEVCFEENLSFCHYFSLFTFTLESIIHKKEKLHFSDLSVESYITNNNDEKRKTKNITAIAQRNFCR